MEIQYIGEHILAGRLGNISIIMSFFAALAALIFYAISTFKAEGNWLRIMSRKLFYAHAGFLYLAIGSLYYLIFNHAFEYQYIFQYSSKHLPFQYLVSCFWAGQEGSFLLWAFWQSLLGMILMRKAKQWESPVMASITLSQVFLMVMVLGFSFGSFHLGTSPFVLMRELAANQAEQVFKLPNYIQMISDGNGLNPLLQNYWMVIHPPILFLGYSSVIVPFAFGMAGFLKKDYFGWTKPALPWSAFAGLTLGIGILLGGAWAYVDLTFGGFWAWDPVENASLVPWLMSIAGLHFILMTQKQKQYPNWSFFIVCLAYIMVVYASYLTRSGVLKDTSAHAFGDEGGAWPLVIFTLFFMLIPFVVLSFTRVRNYPKHKELLLSREFWMFVGAIVLVLSAFQIVITTSIPVINKILGTQMAPPTDRVGFYNSWQLPYGILIALLIGTVHFMKYGMNKAENVAKKVYLPAIIALVICLATAVLFPFAHVVHYVFLFFLIYSAYSAVSNLVVKEKTIRNTGAVITHLGITIFMLAVLITFSSNNVISGFSKATMPAEGSPQEENMIIYKNEPAQVGNYMVEYKENKFEDNLITFKIDFYKPGKPDDRFSLYPVIKKNAQMGDVYQPSIGHFIDKDVYTFVSYAEAAARHDAEGYTSMRMDQAKLHDSLLMGNMSIYVDSITVDMKEHGQDALIRAKLIVRRPGILDTIYPSFLFRNNEVTYFDGKIKPGSSDPNTTLIKFRFEGVTDNAQSFKLGTYQKGSSYVVLKVMVFPWISLLWIGGAIMFLGLFITVRKRFRKLAIVEAAEPDKPRESNDYPAGNDEGIAPALRDSDDKDHTSASL